MSKFVEKPSIELAESYIASEDYYWNVSMFLVKASLYLSELLKFSPEIFKFCQLAVSKVETDLDFIHKQRKIFQNAPANQLTMLL